MKTRLLFIDIQTTGYDPNVDSILQLAGRIRIDGVDVDEFNFFMKPYKENEVSLEAFKSHGISQSEAEGFKDQSNAFATFTSILDEHGFGQCCGGDLGYVVGYNVDFDIKFLMEWFKVNNDKFLFKRVFTPCIDVMQLAMFALIGERPNMKNFSLNTVYEYVFDGDTISDNDAYLNVRATERLFNNVSRRLLLPWAEMTGNKVINNRRNIRR